jgi:glycosyltransferase involved in cell wall biosynthesis
VIIVTNVHRAQSDGGVERSAFQTARELARRGHRVNLIYGQGGDLVPEFKRVCASVHHVRYADYTFPESRARALMEHVRLLPAVALAARYRPDVYYMNRTFATEWALQAARLSPAPVVCHWRGTQTPRPRYMASLSTKVSRFIANSAFTRDAWLAAGIDPQKADVVHNGIDAAEYPPGGPLERQAARAELGIPEDIFVAVFVGRLDAEKGVEVLLEAWRQLDVTPDEAQLLLVGAPVLHGDQQAYLDHLTELAPAGTVRFLGARRDVVTPLHAADVAVVPSTWDEPFGRVVIEALATGRPVAGSRVGGIPEILTGPLQRFLFERGDSAGLAKVLSELRGWQEREPDLGDLCTAHVREHFTLEIMVDGIEAALARALWTGSRP